MSPLDAYAYWSLLLHLGVSVKMSDVGAIVMGGPTKEEAREIILRLTGKKPKED